MVRTECGIELYEVSDGYVTDQHKVWWKSKSGPEHVTVSAHRNNINEYPNMYSIAAPKYTTEMVYIYE